MRNWLGVGAWWLGDRGSGLGIGVGVGGLGGWVVGGWWWGLGVGGWGFGETLFDGPESPVTDGP